ncbi:single-stranded DNA-binding protein [Parvimonas parva]|uniref:Single-stranded DNA-binding protein n=1 Tax=Parvimonas parva TaxID=2769485 RepID=A0ABS1CCA5_9FIRM|nr:single-stranded DNA-binding protein [Parvimonas parva]MBK1469217.1 single-stranded DNA-binding protein [Parvimonas parva]
MNINIVTMVGNLTKDPVVVETENGIKVQFSIAVNERIKEKDRITYLSCIAYGKLAENIGEFMKKGYEIGVIGKLRDYVVTLDDGTAYRRFYLLVNSVSFGNNKLKEFKEVDRDDESVLLVKKDLLEDDFVEEIEDEEEF